MKIIEETYIMPGNNFNQRNAVHPENGVCRTIIGQGHAGNEPKVIVASRGRNPQNPSDRTAGNHVEQRLEPNSEGICNTLTSVQKDNLVLEPKGLKFVGGLGEKDWAEDGKKLSRDYPQGERVYDTKGIACSQTAQGGGTGSYTGLYLHEYRIRKLTPLECWRLMDFTDEDFYKAKFIFENEESIEELTRDKFYKILYSDLSESKKLFHIEQLKIKTRERMSNTQLYKQAGNSIVKAVLMAIFKQMM